MQVRSIRASLCCPTNPQSLFQSACAHLHVVGWRQKSVTSTCPSPPPAPEPSGATRAGLDSPSTPEELCWGAVAGSGLSASPCCCCGRCRCLELSGPSPVVVTPPAAAAAAATVPASGMLSISGERRRMKIFSGKRRSGVASQEEGGAWV